MSQQPQGSYLPAPTTSSQTTFGQSRRQHSGQPPLITTVFNRSHASQSNAALPGSVASTPSSPMFSPPSASLSNAPPSMASSTYNPRQWSRSGFAESSRAAPGGPFQGNTRENTGMESSMPSPPPPYTPLTPAGTSGPMRTTPSGGDFHVASPLATNFAAQDQGISRSPPQGHMATQFPPPPKDKSSSKMERDSSKPRFSLSAFTSIVKRPDFMEAPSQPSSPMIASVDTPFRPPAGRRAVSTGGINLPSASTSFGQTSRRTLPEANRWEPGMPLPPPPPGPPPSATARAQSLNRYGPQRFTDTPPDTTNNERQDVPLRPPRTNTLGAIPPTPLGWTDEDPVPQSQTRIPSPPQVRGDTNVPHVDSLFERRSKSRAGRDGSGIDHRRSNSEMIPSHNSAFPTPAKLVLASSEPLLQSRLTERSERAEQLGSGSRSAGQVSPETIRRRNDLRSAVTLTPPYTPATKQQNEIPKRAMPDYSIPAAMEPPPRDTFVQSSLERFHMFIQQEASSSCDEDRLELFANFMVQESRIRRDRYSTAFNSMAGEIMDLTRDMWRPMSSGGVEPGSQPASGGGLRDTLRISASPEGSRKSGNIHTESPCSSATEFTPATDTESVCDGSECGDSKPPPIASRGEKFQPSLSPIRSVPSMAVSAVPDEEGSRGRSASRWWEGSADGSVGHGGRRLEMTKQESRYMSLHPNELILAAQPSPSQGTPTPGTTKTSFDYTTNEYPPEKVGLHEEDVSTDFAFSSQPAPAPPPGQAYRGKQPMKPSLDVSRLVTLPPPYPRHYPALQNNHPSLHAIRVRHRDIASMISTRQTASLADTSWQPLVYSSMLQTCESSIQELVIRLNSTSENDPAMTAQTEGDERPELLEELTLLKWLFEAREQLQKQEFDAAMQRFRTRSATFTQHCQSTGDFQREADEDARLTHHLQQSQLAFAEQASNRFAYLLEIVEHHVNRGVEVQLSAFWDIAPPLLEVVHKIPVGDAYSLGTLSVLIPGAELVDNPSYHQFPLQYLFTTLMHAKKSAYQFIESQTNLLCMLHEVRNAAMTAEVRMAEVKRYARGEDPDVVREEMMRLRRTREDEETGVLKERVGVLEGQWDVALGEEIEVVIDGVEGFLRDTGGWDEGLDV